MNIAFDGSALLGPMSRNRGIGNYAMSQLREVIHQERENKYFFFNIFERSNFFEEEVKEGLLQEDDFLCMAEDKFLPVPEFENVLGALLERYIKDNAIDVFYITSPFEAQMPVYQKKWLHNVRVVATVYDIIPYVMQNHYFPDKSNMVPYMERVEMLRWADRLLVISQSAKDDLVNYLQFSAEKIDVIWGAAGPQFQKLTINDRDRQLLLDKYRIDSPYIMCTGGDDERKNIAGLIEAFGHLPRELKKRHQLVIVCKLPPAAVDRYSSQARSLGLKGRIVLTNFVADEELVQLYNLAELVAFPSKYEGFGLPIVEAWACGTPVLTSNNSSLIQIAGDAAILVDPASAEDIARGLEKALTICNLEELAQRGAERLKRFQWPAVARETIRCFKKLDAAPAEPEAPLSCRIAFFTPLPPVQSGIADYSVDILSALSAHFEQIDVFIDEGYRPDCALPENVAVYPHQDYIRKRAQYRDTIYQIGNSEYHIYMWPYLKQCGGTLVLHDYNLHDVAQYAALAQQKNLGYYEELLLEDLTPEMVKTHLEALDRGICLPAELNGFVTNYANKIIVHSCGERERLLRGNIGRNVRWIRHYARIEPLTQSDEAKKALGMQPNMVLFAAFGHVQETKRAVPILRAFARLAQQNENVRFVFVGKLNAAMEKEFPAEIRTLGLEGRVQVTGYVSLKEFEQYINAADVCLNLRWPYHGETSGSLMRILAKGKCVIVNDVGSFSEIPDEACIKIPSAENVPEELEVRAIYRAMEKVVDQDGKRQHVEQNARRFAEKFLDLNIIAAQYAEWIVSSPNNVVTEGLLGALKTVLQERKVLPEHMRRIAHTLAWVK